MKEKGFSVPTWLKVVIDYIVVIIGISAMVLSFARPECCVTVVLTVIAGILGFLCTIIVIVLGLFSRARFDWHLVNGNYILKVIAIVLLMPFSLSLVVGDKVQAEDLVYEENLYTYNCQNPPESVSRNQDNPPVFWTIYYHFIDPGNQHMTASKEGRHWAAIIGILGVFLLNGLLISSIVGWIDSRKERWLKGDVRYKGLLFCKRHYIVIGGNDMAVGIVRQLLKKDKGCLEILKPYIVIQTSKDVESLRRALFSNMTPSQQKRIIIYYGNRTSVVDIHDLRLRTAAEVFVLGEDARQDDIESYHDTMNMECLRLISSDVADCRRLHKDNPLICRVMFEYQTSFNVFKVTDIITSKIKFIPFNYYEKWAQNVLICQELNPEDIKKCYYRPLEGLYGIKSEDSAFVHLIVIGMSRMGVAMAIEAAHLAHFPNYESKGKRSRITFIDKNADVEKEFFMGRFKELFTLSHWRYGAVADDKIKWEAEPKFKLQEHLGGDFIDIEWEFIKGSVESDPVQQYIADSSADKDARLTIAVCIPENSGAIAAAAYLPDSVYQSESTVQVLVYQRLNDELVRQIGDNNVRYYKKIKAFGMAAKCYDFDLVELSEHIGDAVDKAWYKYTEEQKKEREKLRQELGTEATKEPSKEPMKEDKKEDTGKTAAAKMWSNHYNVHAMWTKFRSVTTSKGHVFDPMKEDFDEIGSDMMIELGKMEHNRWNMEQLLLRYRPLTDKEQEEAKVLTLLDPANAKDEYKSRFAHLDICSNSRLDEIDYKMSQLDQVLIAELPSSYRQFLMKKNNGQ